MKMRKPWKACSKKLQRSTTCAAYPGWDQSWPPWSSARSTASSASPRLRSFVATPSCVLPPTAAGAKLFKANCYDNKWLRWAFVEAAWVAIGCSAYFGDFYKRKRALGKKPSLAILATARLMARITWQLLTQRRAYTSLAQDPIPPKPACRADCLHGRLGQGSAETAQRSVRFPSKKTFPSRSKIMLVGR
jgi:hypothetical protein